MATSGLKSLVRCRIGGTRRPLRRESQMTFREMIKELVYELSFLERESARENTEAVVNGLCGEAETAMVVADQFIVLGAIPRTDGLGAGAPWMVQRGQHEPPHCQCGDCYYIAEKMRKAGFNPGELATTEQVAWFFKSRAANLSPEDGEKMPAAWAPAAIESFAAAPIGGGLGKPELSSDDTDRESNRYEWFDLTKVRIGDGIYRISCTDTAWIFLRKGEGWEIVVLPEADWPKTHHERGNRNFGDMLAGAMIVTQFD